MELFKEKPNFNFLAWTWLALIFSAFAIGASVYVWIDRGVEKYGIDFRGGYEVKIKVHSPVDTEKMAAAMDSAGLENAAVQSFEKTSEDYSIRIGLTGGLDSKQVVALVDKTLKSLYGDKYEIVQTDSVGATIGEELKRKAILATILGLLGVLIYMAFRFEFSFSLGAVIAMFHDVIVATGFYLWAGHDLNGSALAAALTIVGYSVNDTIVIFDRVREESRKRKEYKLADLINESNNACLSRTVITSALTLLSVAALYFFGGIAIQDLSLFLLVGMISGVYSTVYIAGPVTLAWEKLTVRKAKTA